MSVDERRQLAVAASDLAPAPAGQAAGGEVGRPTPVHPFGYAKRERSRFWRRFFLLLSVLVIIVLPTALASWYYAFVARDQYVTQFKFAVRGGMTAAGKGGGLSSAIGAAGAEFIGDAFVATEYITSPDMVDKANKEMDFQALFGASKGDFLMRLRADATKEDMQKQWRWMVVPSFDVVTGIVTVTVNAFTPDDALKLAELITRHVNTMFLKMTEQSRADAVRFAKEEVERAQKYVEKTRADLRNFRETQRLLDPGRTAQASTDLSGSLRANLTAMNADLATMSTYMAPNAPQIMVLKTRIRSVEEQLRKIEGSGTGGGTGGSKPEILPAVLAEYEGLQATHTSAEKALAEAFDSLQRANAQADRQTTYLALFDKPVRPEAALYPERIKNTSIVLAIALAIWLIAMLIYSSIMDHLL